MRNLAFSFGVALLSVGLVQAQPAKTTVAKPRPAAPPAPPVKDADKKAEEKPADSAADKHVSTAAKPSNLDVEVLFADGSLVKLTLLDSKLDIATRFGKLQVPLSEIRRIDLGIRYPDGALQKIEEAITRLGDPDFKKREQASAELLAFRELAYPHVKRIAATSTNPEVVKRAKTLTEEMRTRIPEEKLALKDHDTVTTYDFAIAGHVEAPLFKARSPLLGDVEIKLVQARAIRWLGSTSEVSLTLDASKYGLPQETWMETGIETNGDKIQVSATGNVDVMPNNPGQFTAGPDGLRQDLGFRGRGARYGPPGALVGRIGNGQPFLIGSKYEGTPSGEGKLYLRLEPSPWNTPMSGNFSIKIVTGK
jgi:hypothetical protein